MKLFNRITQFFKEKKEKIIVLFIGLNYTGKSTILNHFKKLNPSSVITLPTAGYSIDDFIVSSNLLTGIDMSGEIGHRNLWKHNLHHCQGIIYVIDSTDKLRLVVIKDELTNLFNNEPMTSVCIPILFICNEKNNSNNITSMQIEKALGLKKLDDKPWRIITANALTGEGLIEGVQWLIHYIHNN